MENELLKNLDTSSWETWKKSLGAAVKSAEGMGIPEDQISNYAAQFGSYLQNIVNPDLPENQSLKELWEAASPDEQKAIASAMVRLVTKD